MTKPDHRTHARRARSGVPLAALLVLLAAPPLVRCGGSSNPTSAPPARPTFTPPATAAAPNLVRLTGGDGVRSDRIEIIVGIGGPTTSTDITTYGFDLVVSDPTLLADTIVAASAGDALDGQDAEKTVVASAMTNGRFTFGVTKIVLGAAGNGVGAAGATIASITFRTLKRGSTAIHLDNVVALDHTGQAVTTVTFDPSPGTISQP